MSFSFRGETPSFKAGRMSWGNMPKNSQLLVDLGKGLSIMIGLPIIAAWNTDTRPKNPKRGTFGFNIQTNNLEYWDGTSWFIAPMNKS